MRRSRVGTPVNPGEGGGPSRRRGPRIAHQEMNRLLEGLWVVDQASTFARL